MGNQLNRKKRAAILRDMVERQSVRGLHRTKEGNTGKSGLVSRTSVLKLIADAGDVAIEFLKDKMRDLPTRYVEADEMFAFVGIRGITLFRRKMRAPPGMGVFWIWMAIDADSKLIVAWHVGKRGSTDAKLFLRDLKKRCPNRLQLTTDSHSAYYDAADTVFGTAIDYATVKKQDDTQEQLVMEEYLGPAQRNQKNKRPKREMHPPVVRIGDPDMDRVTTNHIESFFQKLRLNNSRFARRSPTHSKTLINLKRGLALYIFHYNFGRIHMTLGTTPAIKAGIEDTRWTWEDFIKLVEEAQALRKADLDVVRLAEKMEREQEEVIRLPAPRSAEPSRFTVMYSVSHKYAKIHLTSCKHLRDTPERQSRKGDSHKFQCETFEAAENLAHDFVPDEVEVCKVCLGSYHRLDTGRGRGGNNLKH